MDMPTVEQYPHLEADIEERLGVTRRDLKRIRKEALVAIRDFELVGGAIRYSNEGLEALGRVLGQKNGAVMEDVVGGVSYEKPAAMDLRVERLCPNPIWVQCRHNGRLENVRVRNSRELRVGAILVGVEVKDGAFSWRVGR